MSEPLDSIPKDAWSIEHFNEARVIHFDRFNCLVDLKFNLVTFTDATGDDVVLLDVDEARSLRDWLNQVIP